MIKERTSTGEELALGRLAAGAKVKRWWYVQGNVSAATGGVSSGRACRKAPYHVAVDLGGVPRNYLARLTAESDVGSPADWCRRELQTICDWLVHGRATDLARGGEVLPEVIPLEDVSRSAAPDTRSLLGHTALLPGADFYLLNHPGYSRFGWEGDRDCLDTPLAVSR